MIVLPTKTALSLEGANEKRSVSVDGKLALVKKPIQENCYDTWVELMVYRVAQFLGVPCCEAGMLNSVESYSVVDRSVRTNLVEAGEFLNLSSDKFTDVLETMQKSRIGDCVIEAYLRQTLFDLLTRQLDRNLTNFSFVKSSVVSLYPLYDNGLALFSTTTVADALEFRSVVGDVSTGVLNALVEVASDRDLGYYDLIKNKLTAGVLSELWGDCPEVFVNGNKKEDLICWVIRQQDTLMTAFSTRTMDLF